jgi:hypothetical protein
MKTNVHHAKLGKPPRIADIMLLTKAMIQASCAQASQQKTLIALRHSTSRGLAQVLMGTDKADGDGGQRKGVANDAPKGERRPPVVSVAVFHFAKRWGAQRAVRGHKFRGEGSGSRAGGESSNGRWEAGTKRVDWRFKTLEAGSTCNVARKRVRARRRR